MIDYNKYIDDTIQILNSAGVHIMDLSQEERKRALDLEEIMNETVNADATEIFFRILDEWKTILMSGNDFNAFELQANFNG